MLLTDLKAMKCKTCGEPLDIGKAQGGVIKCAICDSVFTLPKVDASQKVLDFLSQGEHDLDTCRFDDAYSAFNKACELDKTEPEAYWGMALAEFKIQYLKDEVNNRLQPICHEISDKDFADSSNFLKAIRYATEAQKAEYEKKSEEINYIKNEFYKIAKTGAKYDCFICVKVTDEKGGRTQDYKHADDIYFELKGKGYKPFFSERELVGVTGADYEARILYALKSAECMLVICFDEAYLRTKWVKNEYSRFLKLVNDEEKESDSIALVFGDRPVEKLPGKKGKIQGIALNSLTAMERIVSFVDSHTPEARKRREEQTRQKEQENEAQRQKFAEQEERLRQLEEMLKAQQNATRQAEEEKAKKQAEERERKERAEEERKAIEERERQEREVREVEARERQARELLERNFKIANGILIKYLGTDSVVRIPDEVRVIGKEAFKYCRNITRVIIPNGVTDIGESAFRGCEKLSSIGLPLSVTNIGKFAFERCVALKNISIPNSVKSIGVEAFEYCTGLTGISLSNSITTIGGGTFLGCSALTSITVPKGVTVIGGSAFQGCSALTGVTLPEGLKTIGPGAFLGCKKLKKIIIPKSVTEIAKDAFHGGYNSKYSYTDAVLTIYCRAEKKPEGWDKNWNKKEESFFGSRHNVVWSYKGN